MDRRILSVDWLSRLFSIVGLLGTLGIGLYVYNESQETIPDDSALPIEEQIAAKFESQKKLFDDQIADSVRQIAANVDQDLNTRFTNQEKKFSELESLSRTMLRQFDIDSHKSLDNWNSSLTNREDVFDQYVKSLDERITDISSKLTLNGAGGVDEDEDEVKAEIGSQDDAEVGPGLQIAHLTLRPSSAKAMADGETLISNSGTADATITSIEFMPESTYEAGRPSDEKSLLFDDTRIVFSPADNQATNRSKHKTYIKVLSNPEIISPNKTLSLRVEIDNATHLDYGFIGSLKLRYDDGKVLVVPNARVRFVDESQGSA